MKTAQGWDGLRGQSRHVTAEARLVAPDGTPADVLPVVGGQVEGVATRTGRWSGRITLAGTDWAPTTPDHPLSGLTGHSVQITLGADHADPVVVARLIPLGGQHTITRQDASADVELGSPFLWAAQADGTAPTPTPGETCQQYVARAVRAGMPWTPAVTDTTPTPVPLPADWQPDPERALWEVVEDVTSIADCRCYVTALGDVLLRPLLPEVAIATRAAPAAPLTVQADLTGYTITTSRATFANDVAVRYKPAQGAQDGTVGRAWITTGPLRRDGPAGRITATLTRDITATQAQADAYAASALTAYAQAWQQVTLTAVPDPRIEPDDLITADYLDRAAVPHRVIAVRYDLGTGPMTLTARTALPQET